MFTAFLEFIDALLHKTLHFVFNSLVQHSYFVIYTFFDVAINAINNLFHS